jgi:hypothetical protein
MCQRTCVCAPQFYITTTTAIILLVMTTAAAAAAATETSSHPLLITIAVKIETSGPH